MRFNPPEAVYGGLFGTRGDKTILDAIKDLPKPIKILDGDLEPVQHLPNYLQSHAYRPLPDSVQKFVKHVPNGDASPRSFPHPSSAPPKNREGPGPLS